MKSLTSLSGKRAARPRPSRVQGLTKRWTTTTASLKCLLWIAVWQVAQVHQRCSHQGGYPDMINVLLQSGCLDPEPKKSRQPHDMLVQTRPMIHDFISSSSLRTTRYRAGDRERKKAMCLTFKYSCMFKLEVSMRRR